LSNLRQIGVATMNYSMDNDDRPIPARHLGGGVYEQLVITPATADAATYVGLQNAINAPTCWNCPSRPGLPLINSYGEYQTGYQYFGGVTKWLTKVMGKIDSRSPVKMSTARPNWVLAAEANAKYDLTWGGDFRNKLPHPKPRGVGPDGGNQLWVDGSAQWVKFEKMYFITSWNPNSRYLVFYQEDLGELETKRDQIIAKP
jgi:hypothetical protein